MYIYDSVQKQKVKLIPQNPKHISMYICGPTVYDDAHLGHARSAIAFDVIRRVLIYLGYDMIYAQNITDIDDKIINKSKATNQNIKQITKLYTTRYIDEMRLLNVLDPDIRPHATECIESMKSLILNLKSKDIAYQTSDGVYFDTSKDSKYNSISHQQNDENSKARVSQNIEKRHSSDFALWKFQPESEVGFEFELGFGRPGWHIECSAMIDEHLNSKQKYMIDIHGGGMDLLFPHHENEASQSRCSSNQELAKYWMHNGFVNIDGTKMSKSLGNSFFIKDTIQKYHPEALRFYLLSTHYRGTLNFSWDNLESSKGTLDKLYRLKKRIFGLTKTLKDSEFETNLLNALKEDINISEALAHINDMIAHYNEELDKSPKNKELKLKINYNLQMLSKVLGIVTLNPYEYFQFGLDSDTIKKINNIIAKRIQAKQTKNFTLADKLRDELLQMGISIMDTNETTYWEKA